MNENHGPQDDVEVKAFEPESLEIKDEAKGEVEAIIATLNVVDRDSEVILPTAIKSGSKVKMSAYGHDIVGGLFGGSAAPVGKGVVHIEGDKAVFRGKIFVTTERGRETLEILKEMGKDQEWSFGMHVLGAELPDEAWKKKGAERLITKADVFEVSPVLLGAGIGTRTVAAKAAKQRVKQLEQEAEATRLAEEKAEADRLAAAETETKRLADEAAAVETKRLEDEAQLKAMGADALAEYERVQRALKRLGVA